MNMGHKHETQHILVSHDMKSEDILETRNVW